MATFIIGLVILFGGAALYGRFCEKVFGPDDRQTPAYAKQDGVDYIPMKGWRNSLINLLNIAGTGPILGPIQGILFGPIAFITIPIGNVIGGAMHDYFSGMICLRDGGTQMPQMIKRYSNKGIFNVYNVFCCLLLLLVGAVFVYTPGDIAATQVFNFSGAANATSTWVIYGVIFVYYLVATVFPIDKIIGRIYPIFGGILLFSAIGVFIGLFVKGYPLVEVWNNVWEYNGVFNYSEYFAKGHFFPIFFVTVACGILSGFHSTQSPLMARCLKDERLGRPVFYGAMVAEGVICLIWAAAGVTFFDGTSGLQAALKAGGPGGAVYDICVGYMGTGIGAILAMLGVVACPITSGDTAFRAARLTLADWFKIDQVGLVKRLAFAVPLLGIGAVLSQMNFNIIWRYFSWTNQTLAMIVLWTGAVYLYRHCEGKAWLMACIPATFMSVVTSTYILQAKEGLELATSITYPAGIVFGAVCLALYLKATVFKKNSSSNEELEAAPVENN